jgi:hypothetical protein
LAPELGGEDVEPLGRLLARKGDVLAVVLANAAGHTVDTMNGAIHAPTTLRLRSWH